MQSGLTDRGDLDVVVLRPVDRVEPEEREEHVRVDPLHASSIGHDQPGIDALQRAARDDHGDLVDGVAHGVLLCGIQMQPRGFGIPPIFAASLAGPLGKSWYSSLIGTPEVFPSERIEGALPVSR